MDDGRLIVKRLEMNPRRQRSAKLVNLRVYFVRHVERVALRLPIHVEQHRGLPVSRYDGVDRSHGRRDGRDVAEPNGDTCSRILDDNQANLFGSTHLAADETEHEVVVVFEKSGRIDQIRAANGIQDLCNRDARGQKARGIGHHLKFGDTAALNDYRGDAVETVDARLQIIGRDFPELVGRKRVRRQAVANDGEYGEREAMCFHFCRCRKFGLQARHHRIDSLQRQNHVGIPVEE